MWVKSLMIVSSQDFELRVVSEEYGRTMYYLKIYFYYKCSYEQIFSYKNLH